MIEDQAPAVRGDARSALPGPAEVAAYVGVAVQTLSQWRWQKIGPPWIKVGGRVRYRWEDVDAWLAEREVTARR